MLVNPPPSRCERCARQTHSSVGSGLAAGDVTAWILLEGPDAVVTLDDGRSAARRGRGWVCRSCGFTVPLSREFPR